jgi:hypothetical protein
MDVKINGGGAIFFAERLQSGTAIAEMRIYRAGLRKR